MGSPAPGGYVVGIDLGTSNTVAVIRSPDGRRRPVLFDGAPLMASNVFLADNGQLAVGRDAARLAQLDPARYEPNPKRRIDEPSVLLGSVEVPTVHMLAAVLRAAAVGVAEITRFAPPVVLTYPASWGQTRRKTLHDAAIAAGWQDVSMIPEPVAAARYFISALNHPLPPGEAVVVYDFGGGTIDIAVVRNEPQGFVVVGSGGLEDVGGLDLDASLVELLGGVLQTSAPDVWRRLQDPRTAQDRRDRRLFWEDVRGAKEMLSRTTVAPVSVPGVEAAMHLTREELESRIGPMIARTVAETARVVRDSALQPRALTGILLVGGSSRVPLVARMLHRELSVVPTVLEQPELPVAEGAVVHPSELVSSFTGSASVSAVPVPKPPVMAPRYETAAMPVSGGPAMPVSAVPMSAPPVSPISAIPVSPAVVAAPVAPPEPAEPSSKAALIAGIAVVLLVIVGGIFALKSYTGSSGGDAPKTIGQWTPLPDLPGVPLEGAAAAIVDNAKLYVMGGLSAVAPRGPLNTVYIYDIDGKRWSKGPDLPEAMSHTAAVTDPAGAIWVFGGLTGAGATDKVWKLPKGSTRWEEGPALPKPRDAGAAVYDGERIVYAGGTEPGGDSTDTIWVLGDKGWQTLGTPLIDKREKLAAATDGTGTIYFVGGVQQSNGNRTKDTIDMLVHQTKVVNNDLKLDHPREGAVAFKLTGLGLCVLGGNEGGTVYDWWCQDASKTPQLPKQAIPRSGMAMATAGGVIYVVGGYNGSKNLDGTSTVESFKYTG